MTYKANITYNPQLKDLAKNLRKQGVLSEVLLWQALKQKRVSGYDFHRQKPIGNFIVDFFCPQLMLAIEIDGVTHDYKVGSDVSRQKEIESLGVRFLRFTDSDVRHNLEGVVTMIEQWINSNKLAYSQNTPPPPGTPLKRRMSASSLVIRTGLGQS